MFSIIRNQQQLITISNNSKQCDTFDVLGNISQITKKINVYSRLIQIGGGWTANPLLQNQNLNQKFGSLCLSNDKPNPLIYFAGVINNNLSIFRESTGGVFNQLTINPNTQVRQPSIVFSDFNNLELILIENNAGYEVLKHSFLTNLGSTPILGTETVLSNQIMYPEHTFVQEFATIYGTSIIQSNYKSDNNKSNRNLEIVVSGKDYSGKTFIAHNWRHNGTNNWQPYFKTINSFTDNSIQFQGVPTLIQNSTNNDFELFVPKVGGGIAMYISDPQAGQGWRLNLIFDDIPGKSYTHTSAIYINNKLNIFAYDEISNKIFRIERIGVTANITPMT